MKNAPRNSAVEEAKQNAKVEIKPPTYFTRAYSELGKPICRLKQALSSQRNTKALLEPAPPKKEQPKPSKLSLVMLKKSLSRFKKLLQPSPCRRHGQAVKAAMKNNQSLEKTVKELQEQIESLNSYEEGHEGHN